MRLLPVFCGLAASSLNVPVALAAGAGVTFDNIADDPASGLGYSRAQEPEYARVVAFREQSLQQPVGFFTDFVSSPFRTYGQPGTAIFDYDRDGDLDIYVTNGAGTPNSLFSNQLVESGVTSFIDVAEHAGVTATDQGSTGVCYGDIDNDGDEDLFVLGRSGPRRLFENLGDGTFTELPSRGVEGEGRYSASCAMGDVNGDGLLDIVVGNTFDHSSFQACFVEPFSGNQHNELYINQGDNTFADVSAAAGVESLGGLPAAGLATITWATAMVDVDLDGDLDIIFGDDQCGYPEARFGGVDRGFLHILLNDGAGHFTDRPAIMNDRSSSSWMGIDFGDFDCDGRMDMFGSNFGDFDDAVAGLDPYTLGDQTSRWLLGNGDGSFRDPVQGSIVSVYGWGNGVFDYDNDGDQDIVYHGGMEVNLMVLLDNPGVVLRNRDCTADFEVDTAASAGTHVGRDVQGVAIGDLNADGFDDVVSVAGSRAAPSSPLVLNPQQWPSTIRYADQLNPTAFFLPIFDLVDPVNQTFVWNGTVPDRGDLVVELNSADNGNRWVQVSTLGTVGLLPNGRVNRDGIGAVLKFTPMRSGPRGSMRPGKTVMRPVLGGSSFGSQHSLQTTFGLGAGAVGKLEVVWPGGVKNVLFPVVHGERIRFPEIPCSHDGQWRGLRHYRACVDGALDGLVTRGALTRGEAGRFRSSALAAYRGR